MRLTAFFQDWVNRHQKGKPFWILLEREMMGVAVASAGPYANHLHIAADRQPRQYLTTQFLQAGCPFCHPTNSVKALKSRVPGIFQLYCTGRLVSLDMWTVKMTWI